MDPPKRNFLNGLSEGASFFDIGRYLTDKYFDIVWGYHPSPGSPRPKGPAKNPLFEWLKLGFQFFF